MRRRRRGTSRGGFTMIEMIVVCGLTVLLSLLLGTIWRGFCRPTIEAAARCRIALEANLAAASFARDLGGSLADPAGRVGASNDFAYASRSVPASDTLRLSYRGATDTSTTPPTTGADVVVSYQLQGDKLIRSNETDGTSVVVATDITDFSVESLSTGDGVTITLTFSVRGLSLTYTLVAVDPPSAS